MAVKIKLNFNVYGLIESFTEDGVTYQLQTPIDRAMFKAHIAGNALLPISDTEYIMLKPAGSGGGTSNNSIPTRLLVHWLKPIFKWKTIPAQPTLDTYLTISDTLNDFYDLVDQWWDTRKFPEEAQRWFYDNYFWDNLDKFYITIHWGDSGDTDTLIARPNAIETIDGALFAGPQNSDGYLVQTKYWDYKNNRFAEFPRDEKNANYYFMLRFYEFTKEKVLIRGYHGPLSAYGGKDFPRLKSSRVAIKGFIITHK